MDSKKGGKLEKKTTMLGRDQESDAVSHHFPSSVFNYVVLPHPVCITPPWHQEEEWFSWHTRWSARLICYEGDGSPKLFGSIQLETLT